MTYPLEHAIARNQIPAVACHQAINRAMRALHDTPVGLPPLGDFPDDVAIQITVAYRAEAAARYHRRMHTDESRCLYCGLNAAEARAELETE